MNTQMLSKARQLFCHQDAPKHVQRHNMRQWVRSLRNLGDRWLLAKSVRRSF